MVTSVKEANVSQTIYMVPFAYIWSPSGVLVPFEEGQESRRGPRGPMVESGILRGKFGDGGRIPMNSTICENLNRVSLTRCTLAGCEKQHCFVVRHRKEAP